MYDPTDWRGADVRVLFQHGGLASLALAHALAGGVLVKHR